MIAVVVSLVAVVLLVLVVVALGMRSMNRRESSLPPERLKEMAEKEEMTTIRSTDEFAAHEPRMNNFSPDFSPIGEPKVKPVRTGQRGRRGVDEWGNPSSDDEDEEFWANIRSDAEEGGFGAGGTVAARKGASRPVERERPAERPADRPAAERPAEQPAERPAERRKERRGERRAKPQPATAAAADSDATTVQAPLPRRPASAPAANLADLVEPAGRATPSQSELADQRTMTFAAPTADVMTILGAGAQAVPATRPEQAPSSGSYPSAGGTGSFAATNGTGSSFSSTTTGTGSFSSTTTGTGSFPAVPAASANGTGSFPATSPLSSGSFPAVPAAPIHGAPTSDPFPAYSGTPDPLDTTWTAPPTPVTSGAWPAPPDILDDPSPSYGSGNSWPAFEQPAARASYPNSYEVRPGWAVADDSDPLTGPSPATGTPTVPARAVSAYDDVLSAPAPAPAPQSTFAYETGDITTVGGAWPEPPANGAPNSWPAAFGGQPAPAQGTGAQDGGTHRRSPEQDYPHDYYR
ncbi:hypothetical protein [Nonomuraea sp. NPDC002799]